MNGVGKKKPKNAQELHESIIADPAGFVTEYSRYSVTDKNSLRSNFIAILQNSEQYFLNKSILAILVARSYEIRQELNKGRANTYTSENDNLTDIERLVISQEIGHCFSTSNPKEIIQKLSTFLFWFYPYVHENATGITTLLEKISQGYTGVVFGLASVKESKKAEVQARLNTMLTSLDNDENLSLFFAHCFHFITFKHETDATIIQKHKLFFDILEHAVTCEQASKLADKLLLFAGIQESQGKSGDKTRGARSICDVFARKHNHPSAVARINDYIEGRTAFQMISLIGDLNTASEDVHLAQYTDTHREISLQRADAAEKTWRSMIMDLFGKVSAVYVQDDDVIDTKDRESSVNIRMSIVNDPNPAIVDAQIEGKGEIDSVTGIHFPKVPNTQPISMPNASTNQVSITAAKTWSTAQEGKTAHKENAHLKTPLLGAGVRS